MYPKQMRLPYQRKISKTTLHVLAALLLSTALAATANAQYTVAFFDGDFNSFSSGWMGSVAGTNGTATVLFKYQSSGGYPMSWESDFHKLSGTDPVMYAANFNPANRFIGSFASLSYSYDLEDLGAHDVRYAIAVKQGSTVYIADPTAFSNIVNTGNNWGISPNPYFETGLISTQFCEIPSNISYSNPVNCSSNPVFNSPTQTTLFGYAVGNSFIGTGTATYRSGIDNWCVVLNGASGPGGSGRGCNGVPN
jgi:hypothetical protein